VNCIAPSPPAPFPTGKGENGKGFLAPRPPLPRFA
jgi:hypothetical protein